MENVSVKKQPKRLKARERRAKFSVLTVIMLVILSLYCITLISLVLWALLTSFKEPMFELMGNKLGFPEGKWYFSNFSYILENSKVIVEQHGIGQTIFNSVAYAIGGALIHTVVICITAYLSATYAYKFSKIVYTTVLVVMIIPVVGSQASELQLVMAFGFYDHIWGLIIMKANFLGMYFLVFHEMFKSIPSTYREAAEIDGASELKIMTRIMLPLVRNTFLTVFLINVITFWNDYQVPMLYVPNHKTLAEYLYRITIKSMGNFSCTPVQLAAAFMLLAPITILFLAFHKRLMSNLTIGGIKG